MGLKTESKDKKLQQADQAKKRTEKKIICNVFGFESSYG